MYRSRSTTELGRRADTGDCFHRRGTERQLLLTQFAFELFWIIFNGLEMKKSQSCSPPTNLARAVYNRRAFLPRGRGHAVVSLLFRRLQVRWFWGASHDWKSGGKVQRDCLFRDILLWSGFKKAAYASTGSKYIFSLFWYGAEWEKATTIRI